MARVSTYLNFGRNTEEAFNFYKSVFGGEFEGGSQGLKIFLRRRVCRPSQMQIKTLSCILLYQFLVAMF